MAQLLFVYNADSHLLSQLTDVVHKIIAPESYQCSLCKLTHGALTAHKEWKDFLNNSAHTISILHRNEFTQQFPEYSGTQLPAIFSKEQNTLTSIINRTDLIETQSLSDLLYAISTALKE